LKEPKKELEHKKRGQKGKGKKILGKKRGRQNRETRKQLADAWSFDDKVSFEKLHTHD
jgi:hypothetical protein